MDPVSTQMPWEKEGGEFNAEVAKNLILNLRNDKTQLQSKLAEANEALSSRTKELDQANETIEEQKATLSLANDDLSAKDEKLSELESLRSKEHLLIDKGLPLNLVRFIPSGDEDAMTSAVDDLLALRGTAPSGVVDPAQVATPADDKNAQAMQFFESHMNN